MQFENLSFIGPDSVTAGRTAAAAAAQDRLWNFVDLMYLNQGEENTGYVTPSYLRRLLEAVPGPERVRGAAGEPTAVGRRCAHAGQQLRLRERVNATPSFLIGKRGGPLRQFQPPTLTSAPFAAPFDALLKGTP